MKKKAWTKPRCRRMGKQNKWREKGKQAERTAFRMGVCSHTDSDDIMFACRLNWVTSDVPAGILGSRYYFSAHKETPDPASF